MASTLSQFKSALAQGGARPNLFRVTLANNPAVTNWPATNFSILCKAAALPASNVGVIEVPFRGRTFKVAGDRTFDTWTVTVINDQDFSLRTSFEYWAQALANYESGAGTASPSAYMTDAKVEQLGRGGVTLSTSDAIDPENKVLKTYTFHDIFPTNISAIDLSYDTTDTIEEFTVEFQVQYWTPDTVTSASSATNTTTNGSVSGNNTTT